MYTNSMRDIGCNCKTRCNCCESQKVTPTYPVREVFEDACQDVPNNILNEYNPCECGFDEEERAFPRNIMFGQSYVPWQTMGRTFTPEVGLEMGTIFPELVSPYVPGQSQELNEFIAATNKIGEGCNR